MNHRRFKTVAVSQGGRQHVFSGDTPSEPARMWQTWATGQEEAPPAAPATLEHVRAESRLSLLEAEHEELAKAGDTHETAVEIARHAFTPILDSVVMTATGALRASIARPDLVASAIVDAEKLVGLAAGAAGAASWPLGKSVASSMVRTADTAAALAIDLGTLPGMTPAPSPAPGPGVLEPAGPHHHDEPGDVVADDGEPPPPRRRARGWGVAAAVAGAFGLVAILGRR